MYIYLCIFIYLYIPWFIQRRLLWFEVGHVYFMMRYLGDLFCLLFINHFVHTLFEVLINKLEILNKQSYVEGKVISSYVVHAALSYYLTTLFVMKTENDEIWYKKCLDWLWLAIMMKNSKKKSLIIFVNFFKQISNVITHIQEACQEPFTKFNLSTLILFKLRHQNTLIIGNCTSQWLMYKDCFVFEYDMFCR